MLTDAQFRHGLLDPQVEKRRVKIYGRGVYVDVASLEAALHERGYRLGDGELDRYVRDLGGQRVRRWTRPAQYFLPELAFQRVRQRRLP